MPHAAERETAGGSAGPDVAKAEEADDSAVLGSEHILSRRAEHLRLLLLPALRRLRRRLRVGGVGVGLR
eukprot:1482251-Rhodomonas_salina.1